MRSLLVGAAQQGVTTALRSCVTAARFDGVLYDLEVNGGEYRVSTRVVVNSAGLQSDRVAALAGTDVDREGYRLKLCKGSYFSASPPPRIRHLVYPVPTPKHEGLGVHATIARARPPGARRLQSRRRGELHRARLVRSRHRLPVALPLPAARAAARTAWKLFGWGGEPEWVGGMARSLTLNCRRALVELGWRRRHDLSATLADA